MILTREALVASIQSGMAYQFVFFWGHTQKVEGVADRSCFSQWFERRFELAGTSYRSAEHWMMAQKARLFSDTEALRQILDAATPSEAKALGRAVHQYDDAAWAKRRFEAVVEGNLAKFGQHADLRALLLATGDAVLVEAAPRDQVWGIGLGAANPKAADPASWRGQNLLGFALMAVRERLRAEAT